MLFCSAGADIRHKQDDTNNYCNTAAQTETETETQTSWPIRYISFITSVKFNTTDH